MSTFLDTSAVVKLYADEDGSQAVQGIVGPLVVSQMTRVEVPAALWRKCRMGELGQEDTQVLVAEFEADYFGAPGEAPRFSAVRVTAEILEQAVRSTAVHGLRAYDAVQLASALATRSVDRSCASYVVFDKGPRAAAALEGFTVLPGGPSTGEPSVVSTHGTSTADGAPMDLTRGA